VKTLPRRLSLAFAAGAAGGVAASFALWLASASGLAGALEVRVAPAFAAAWLLPRVLWGGVFGLLFLLPLASQRPVAQGLALSLVPSLLHFFTSLPRDAGAGVLERDPVLAAALLVVAVNAAWGVAAAAWLRATGS